MHVGFRVQNGRCNLNEERTWSISGTANRSRMHRLSDTVRKEDKANYTVSQVAF